MAAALLLLAGCGTTSAQTTTQSAPESEAAKFGNKVVDMLNGGKAKALFDLWKGSDEEVIQGLAAAVAPDAKAKGIKWEYKSGDFGTQEGSIMLDYTIDKNKEQIEFKTKKINGEWRLSTQPFAEIVACAPATIDGMDAPTVDTIDNGVAPCSDGTGYVEGQVLLALPGKHKFSFQGFDGVFKQPYEAMVYPYSQSGYHANCDGDYDGGLYGCKASSSNILPADTTPADGYVEVVKKALVDELADSESLSFNDDLSVTPTDDPLKPTFGGTVNFQQHSEFSYNCTKTGTINVSDLEISLSFSGTEGAQASIDCGDACQSAIDAAELKCPSIWDNL